MILLVKVWQTRTFQWYTKFLKRGSNAYTYMYTAHTRPHTAPEKQTTQVPRKSIPAKHVARDTESVPVAEAHCVRHSTVNYNELDLLGEVNFT